ncbi:MULTISPECIES: hypothetical protein [unclassified Ekhidna]|uniref:hypothetical protein n=1 Tax=unclassified Ekhidna TaxID=2632188 RepID=UPI0032DE8E53
MTHILWYNNSESSYQFGSWTDYNRAATVHTQDLLPLERFNDASERTLRKIVQELNKCRPKY